MSPHGPRGGCGLESSCLCYACFAELAPAQQAAYERANRLPSGAACNGTDGKGSEAATASRDGGAALQPVAGLEELPPALAGSLSAAFKQPEAAAPDAAAAAGASAEARRRWRKAGGFLRALVRFKAGVADRQPAN